MSNNFCVVRSVGGVSINPLEYLLNEEGEVKMFADEESAKLHLTNLGYSDESIYWMVIKENQYG